MKLYTAPKDGIVISYGIAVLSLRGKNCFLPEYGADGSELKGAKYAIADLQEKVDTGLYGCVYYVSDEYDLLRKLSQYGVKITGLVHELA